MMLSTESRWRNLERCRGVSYPEDGKIEWREGCEGCLRRTLPDNGTSIEPPSIIVFFCPYLVEVDDWTP